MKLLSLKRALTIWLVRQRIGKAASTQHYHWEIVKAIRRAWRDRLTKSPADFTEDDVTAFALRAGHFSASRWNGMLTVLHATIPAARALKRRAIGDGKGYVLPQGIIRTGLAKACQRAGLRSLSHHDFRHMFTTRCIESGVDVPTVARWLGHQDGGALLARTYYHLVDDHSRNMAARVRM